MEPPAALLKDAHIDVDGDGLLARTPRASNERVTRRRDRRVLSAHRGRTIEIVADAALELPWFAKERLEEETPGVPNVGPLSASKLAIHLRPSVPAYTRTCVPSDPRRRC
jgi:hypothetical protein